MNVTLGLIIAFVLAGMVMMLVFQMQTIVSQSSAEINIGNRMHTNTAIVRQLIKNELKIVGFGLTDISKCFRSTQPTSVSFTTDLDSDEKPDSITIKLVDFTTDPTPSNPYDKQLVKVVNGVSEIIPVVGLSAMDYSAPNDTLFWYYDKFFRPTNVHNNIRYIKFRFKLQSTEIVNDEYITSIAEETIFLKNIWQF